jgi:transcriptional regulator with XRE-family HTH domain
MTEDQQLRKVRGSCGNRGVPLPGLKAIRLSKGLSQRDLSQISGVSRETIYRLEGSWRAAYPGTLRKLALALGATPEELTFAPRRERPKEVVTCSRERGPVIGRSMPLDTA